MGKITHLSLNPMSKKRLREPVGGRGDGALLMEKRNSGMVEAYYLYKSQGKETKLKIGNYKTTRNGGGLTIEECRSKARQLAQTRRDIDGDLKEHIESRKWAEQRRKEEERRQAEIEAEKGTLKELCECYVDSLRRRERKSAYQVEQAFKKHVLSPYPRLATAKAADITRDDIINIIRRMIKKGITTTSNRVLSYLNSAYKQAIRADNDPREQVIHGKRFNVQINPCTGVPQQPDFEVVRERYLSHKEIQALWDDFFTTLPNISPVYGYLLRFMLAVGGNRPEQLLQVKWSDVDFFKRTFTFLERKGKIKKPKVRVMPLTGRALEILEALKPISGCYEWVFSVNGDKPTSIQALGNKVRDYCNALAAKARANGEPLPEPFTPKDIRRTATALLIECRVPKDQRFLIQSREESDIESKHYDHSDRLPEKREALKLFDPHLGRVLSGETHALVDLDEYRHRSISIAQGESISVIK